MSLLHKYRSHWIILGIGLVSGLFGGLLGVGGGVIMVPAMVFFLRFDQKRAHGTSLMCVLMLAASGLIVYAKNGSVDLPFAMVVAVGGVLGALIGARVACVMKNKLLRQVFAVFVLTVGCYMILKGTGILAVPPGGTEVSLDTTGQIATAVGIGLGTGFMSALLGVGGGMVMIPAMVLILGISQKLAQGISLAAMIPTALSGMLMHARMGNVEVKAGKWIGLGAIVGALAGGYGATRLEDNILQIVFGCLLLWTSTALWLKRDKAC